MKKIRYGIFETNSSSTHSLTMGTLEDKYLSKDYVFDEINVYPSIFGYDDIVAPFINSNNFPIISEKVCKDCEYSSYSDCRWGERFDCKNPKYKENYSNDFEWYDRQKCEKYINAQNEEMKNLMNVQTPQIRASVLFTCIICMNPLKASKDLCTYFDNLFKICRLVKYKGIVILSNENKEGFWKTEIRRNALGDYDSECWMELHDTKLEYTTVKNIFKDEQKLKIFLFGEGSYAAGDRCG